MINTYENIPDQQQALVLAGKGELAVQTLSVIPPKPGEVLLKIGSVGGCGSDKHFYFDGRCGSVIADKPFIMGHEFGGQIVAVGEGVSSSRLGQRVSVEPLMPCGQCFHCRHGRYNICPTQKFSGEPDMNGAMQQYLCVPATNAYDISDAINDHAAAMVETISVALSGIQKGQIHLGSRVLITGAGPVGLLAIQVAQVAGASEIVVVEPSVGRRQLAQELGALVLADLADNDQQYDVLLECSGVDQVRHDACLSVISGGRAVMIGVGSPAAALPMSAIIEREVTIHGVMRYQFTWPTVIAALEAKQLNTDMLVSRVLGLEQAITAWTQPIPNEIKTMLAMNG